MTHQMICFLAAAVIAFAVTAISTRILIPKLKSMKLGQKILDIGPRWHKSKEGTPTMGGIAMLIGGGVSVLLVGIYMIFKGQADNLVKVLLTLAMAVLYALIGLIDDSVKMKKKQNAGLTAGQKFLLQLIVAGAFIAAMRLTGNLSTALYIPYANISFELGFFYYVFALLLITGVVNSVNLTDGIDGLASGVTFIVAGFFAVAGFSLGDSSVAVIAAAAIGMTLGFLTYNMYPAKIFMGDTGSLFLGGLVVGLAFMIDNPLIILLVGLIYIVETASVILQVLSFKLTGKRIFKMSPIHHHFEMCGWNEIKIDIVFMMITALCSIVAYFGLRR